MILGFNPRYRRQQYVTGDFGYTRTSSTVLVVVNPFVQGNKRVFRLRPRSTEWKLRRAR